MMLQQSQFLCPTLAEVQDIIDTQDASAARALQGCDLGTRPHPERDKYGEAYICTTLDGSMLVWGELEYRRRNDGAKILARKVQLVAR